MCLLVVVVNEDICVQHVSVKSAAPTGSSKRRDALDTTDCGLSHALQLDLQHGVWLRLNKLQAVDIFNCSTKVLKNLK